MMLEFVRQRPELASLVRASVPLYRKFPLIGKSAWGYMLYTLPRIDPNKASEFIQGLATGIGLTEGSPINKLRNRLIQDKAESKRRLSSVEKLAFCVKAWNAFYSGKTMTLFKWAERGRSEESFPRLLGA